MTRDPLAGINTLSTPQSQPIPGRSDMIPNHAGGYVFSRDDRQKLEDFIILGTAGGTYYQTEQSLTAENAAHVIKMAKADGVMTARLAHAISVAKPPRAPKNRGALFTLAAVSAFGSPEAVQEVKKLLPEVARTTDHLSQFFGYRKALKGKAASGKGTSLVGGRALQSTLGSWFMTADVNDVAFRAVKARQRKTPQGEDFNLRDALRLAHPKPDTPERDVLFGWLTGKVADEMAREMLPAVDNYLTAQAVKTPREAVRVINDRRVPWEFLPSEVLASPEVWEALATTTGITAVIRNLARMTRIGTIKPFADATNTVTRRLVDADQLAKGRVHPMDLYLALRVYASGKSQPNPKAPAQMWTPVPAVLDALEEAYELSFGYTEPSGKKILIAVDSSGSMMHAQVTANGAQLGSAYQVANSVALTLKKLEGDNAHVIDVDTQVHSSIITKRTRLAEVQRRGPSGGGTNLSIPFGYASQYQLKLDGFVILTDNETWSGWNHPVQAFDAYRNQYSRHARVIDVAMTPWGGTIADPSDEGVLQVAGLDSALPQLTAGFFRTGEDGR